MEICELFLGAFCLTGRTHPGPVFPWGFPEKKPENFESDPFTLKKRNSTEDRLQ
jgi:hypothetical protein